MVKADNTFRNEKYYEDNVLDGLTKGLLFLSQILQNIV